MIKSPDPRARAAAVLLFDGAAIPPEAPTIIVDGMFALFDVYEGAPRWSSALLQECFLAYYRALGADAPSLVEQARVLLRRSIGPVSRATESFVEDLLRHDMVFGKSGTRRPDPLEDVDLDEPSEAELLLLAFLALRAGKELKDLGPLLSRIPSATLRQRIVEAAAD